MNSLEQIWAIRDARGLDTYEKMFLVTVASRGEAGCFCEWKRNSADMGMKKDAYYTRRNSLVDKGLLRAVTQNEGPTVYTINNDVLAAWDSVSQNDGSATQNGRSATQNEHSVRPERKTNTKNNKKTNSKNNTSRVEDAPSSGKPSLNSDKNEEVKGRGVEGDSPIDLNVEESLSSSPIVLSVPESTVNNTDGHSVTQNEEDVGRPEKNRARAEKALSEYLSFHKCYQTEPVGDEEFNAALDLMLDQGFASRTSYWPERAGKAMGEVRPLVW
jgi:hypothetical protein